MSEQAMLCYCNSCVESRRLAEMPQFKNKREEILLTANKYVNGDRNNQYGDPNQDFSRTAHMWNLLLAHKLEMFLTRLQINAGDLEDIQRLWEDEQGLIDASDVALMQVLLKCSRQMHQKKDDTWIDIAGYAACGADCSQ